MTPGQCVHMKRIPEGKEKNHWERTGGTSPKPHARLGTGHILHNLSQETLGYMATDLSTLESIALVMQQAGRRLLAELVPLNKDQMQT